MRRRNKKSFKNIGVLNLTDKYADLDVDTLRMLLVRRDEQIIELRESLEEADSLLAEEGYDRD